MPSASDRMATVENSTLRRSPRTARRRSPSNVIMVSGLDGGRRPAVVEREPLPDRGGRGLLFWRDLHDQAIAPPVFRVGQRLHGLSEVRLALVIDEPGRSRESAIVHADANVRICPNVADPVRTVAVFGDHVE